MRRSEILNLRWIDVDLAHNCILLPQTKNGEGRIVYLNQNARNVLEIIASANGDGTRTGGGRWSRGEDRRIPKRRSPGIGDEFRLPD